MWRFIGVLIALAVIWWWMPTRMSAQSLPLFENGARAGEQRVGGTCLEGKCLIVYVAPWCPSCRAAQPMLKELRRALAEEKIPVSIVAGMDKPPALETYAQTLSYPVLLDIDGQLSHSVKIKALPYFIVINIRGEIVKTVRGAYPDVRSMREHLAL
ncbi:MAG TPA: TlpA disulfide reductase family protein [Steroidobacteraceae bacterium]|nr:TlpA disulfide reductase family protein [Steroidobacteraceae bacterium]